jgi:uncharacterized protein YjiS (DUF1127 family)
MCQLGSERCVMPDPDPITFCDPIPPLHLAARIAERLRLWREHRRWVRGMEAAATLSSLDHLLNDVELTRAELDRLIGGPPDAGRQLETLAGMARVDLRGIDAAALREATWKCARCANRAACRAWLRDGVWRGDGDTRCPNAALLRH